MTSNQRSLNFLSYYESLIFEEAEADKNNASPSTKAHIQRKLMAQLHYSVNSGQKLVSSSQTCRVLFNQKNH